MPLKPKKIRRFKPSRRTATGFKPTKIPKGFVLLIDTREQKPLFAKPIDGLTIVRTKVDVGDYTVRGYEDRVCVELKRLSDFDSFMGSERIRKTLPKLKRMGAMDWSALVVNISETMLFGKRRYGKMTREHARGFLKKVRVGYGIHVYWTTSTEKAERYVLDHLCYAYEILKGV